MRAVWKSVLKAYSVSTIVPVAVVYLLNVGNLAMHVAHMPLWYYLSAVAWWSFIATLWLLRHRKEINARGIIRDQNSEFKKNYIRMHGRKAYRKMMKQATKEEEEELRFGKQESKRQAKETEEAMEGIRESDPETYTKWHLSRANRSMNPVKKIGHGAKAVIGAFKSLEKKVEKPNYAKEVNLPHKEGQRPMKGYSEKEVVLIFFLLTFAGVIFDIIIETSFTRMGLESYLFIGVVPIPVLFLYWVYGVLTPSIWKKAGYGVYGVGQMFAESKKGHEWYKQRREEAKAREREFPEAREKWVKISFLNKSKIIKLRKRVKPKVRKSGGKTDQKGGHRM